MSSAPARTRAASSSASVEILASSIPPSVVVREDEPTLTTTLRAAEIAARGAAVGPVMTAAAGRFPGVRA